MQDGDTTHEITHVKPLAGLTFTIQTFGCQMNEHDSERVAGMLCEGGCIEARGIDDADIIVFMTCCVRENAEKRLHGRVASLSSLPCAHGTTPRAVAVGGCMAQRDAKRLAESLPNVGVVFGTHNISALPGLIEAFYDTGERQISVLSDSDEDATVLPSSQKRPWHAWLPITSGCNNFCTYCIVPYVRGRERSRKLEDIVAEAQLLVAGGTGEITLLGQNVNSYGRDIYGRARFADVLRAVGETGVRRLRFATSHPKDLSDETICAMAETPAVMPQLHLPVQAGSNRILNLMNRSYTRESYLELVAKVRDAMPDIALSTDIIVGFPGETEADFKGTLELAKEVQYAQAFTFIYSPREGTPAAHMEQNASREEIRVRFDRLVDVIQDSAYSQNQVDVGETLEVLVEGASKRDSRMLAGRSPKNQIVHAPLPLDGDGAPVPAEKLVGKFIDVRIHEAKTWYLTGEIEGDALPEGIA